MTITAKKTAAELVHNAMRDALIIREVFAHLQQALKVEQAYCQAVMSELAIIRNGLNAVEERVSSLKERCNA